MTRWTPTVSMTRREEFVMKRLVRTKKLFAFLRLHRHELFDDSLQEELESMYRTTGAGTELKDPLVFMGRSIA